MTVVFCVRAPPVPRTVTGYVPAVTFDATLSARVDVSVAPVSVAGVKTPVIPVGGFTSDSATSAVKLVLTMATDVLPLAPAARFRAAGVAAIVKFVAVTISEYVAVAAPTPVALARTVIG